MSVFVSANAGAGKTSLLTSRVLGLLLHGVSPSRILCLTFTNAAAAEMSNRVLKELGKWVMAAPDDLEKELAKITGSAPPAHLMERARGLFATVLEAPEGVRIQTIHSFSQSLLRRFPIEAGVSPHFSLIDERTVDELLKEARMRLFSKAQAEDSGLLASLHAIAHGISEFTVQKLLEEIVRFKSRFLALFSGYDAVNGAIADVYAQLGISQDTNIEMLLAQHFTYDAKTLSSLREITSLLVQGKKDDKLTGEGLAAWLEHAQSPQRSTHIQAYVDSYLTGKGEARKNFFNKNTLSPQQEEAVLAEKDRVLRLLEAWKTFEVAESTAHMLRVAHELLALYETLKRSQVQMDYDDLILTARNLLERPGIAPWVLFKLDGGIDHVLIDEAQDTSPIQWKIVKALTEEFFSGLGRTDADRSLFVVGDEKQSIYSFQGADPAALGKMQRYFTHRIKDAGMQVQQRALTKSYRSTQAILSATDAVFANASARRGLTFDDSAVEHIIHRREYYGLVEMWPLLTPAEDDENAPPPVLQLARQIASTIRGWLDNGMYIESKKRNIEAGDIMILVRNRRPLADPLIRALKRSGIPVAGHDRMELGENLAIADLIALGQCLLLPEDDLTLACVLKSPICNLSEEDLFTLAHNRGDDRLWTRLYQLSGKPPFDEAFTLLSDLRSRADFVKPYELYAYLLETLGVRRRITGRMGSEYHDPIDEFLGQALLYERSHTPSLQGFIHWITSSTSEIKRDMEQAHNQVRILTVHGAKGLQAPIVILPDTAGLPPPKEVFLWQEDETMPLPFWPRAKSNDNALCTSLRQQKRQAALQEYRRQLYVALTRAEDQLYICGALSKENASEESWYSLIKAGLEPVAQKFEHEKGEGLRLGELPAAAKAFASAPAKTTVDSPAVPVDLQLAFLRTRAPNEPNPPQPLVPSRMAAEEPAAASPLTGDTHFYQRGTLIHRLLQYLPEVAEIKRAQAGANIAALYRKSMPQDVLDACVREAMHIITHPPFAFLFGEGSLAEAPVAGCVDINGRQVAVAGQIDRMHIGEKEVWIVDFKSNRTAPDDLRQIPAAYLSQMRLYQLLMQRIYPEKKVCCGLLWTAVPKLTPLDEALLDEVDTNTYI
jgi:ATP-dependent helicase/nuclease subunit A